MSFASAVSLLADTAAAAREALAQASARLVGPPRLIIGFYSPHHAVDADELADILARDHPGAISLGVQAQGAIQGRREFENQPAIAVWEASWDATVTVDSFHLEAADTGDGPTLLGWPDALLDPDPRESLLLCLADPYTFPVVDLFLPRLNEDHPGVPVIGGMASSPIGSGSPALIRNGEVVRAGAVGVLIRGARFRTVVSQGCRPIGQPLVVTRATDNIIAQLGGLTPLEYLRQLIEQVSPQDQLLMQKGLLLGLAMNSARDRFDCGDFLIRNLISLDPRTGALAVADRVRLGQTVQFQVRDAATADHDLRQTLKKLGQNGFRPAGALLFSCNGRGTHMFAEPNHDAAMIQDLLGPLELAGMFAAGEFGPVAGTNFIHGFTASGVFFA